jgi:hypothetical protein
MADPFDDPYMCGIDDFSETEIRDSVENLNYLIDCLILGILVSRNQDFPRAREELKPVPGGELHEYLKDCRLSEGDAREVIVEFFMRDMIFSLLYTHFFEGEVFSGVGSGDLQKSLELMMENLASGGE